MKVLTLHQPWATLIALGVKTIETRPNNTNVRGRIAIHAAARQPVVTNVGGEFGWDLVPYMGDGYTDAHVSLSRGGWYGYERPNPPGKVSRFHAIPLGCIVATAELIDCVPVWPFSPAHDNAAPHICLDERPDSSALLYPGTTEFDYGEDITDQLPYGDYRPGRFAWLLDNIEPVAAPVPFKGGQGWSKSWEPS